MGFYSLFTLNLTFLLYRFFRSRKIGERTVLTSLFLFLLLALSVHPWLGKVDRSLSVLEMSALWVSLFWLAGGPLFFWIEKKRKERNNYRLLRSGKGPFSEIVWACRMLSEARQGALIAVQRKGSLEKWLKTAVPLDAQLRRETIFSVFTPPGALHDGGMIIQGDRIAASGVIFPLSKRFDLPTELGTRHRAGLGMSESTDALIIIVSEETGKISFADRGSLLYDIKQDQLEEILESALKNRFPKKKFRPSPTSEFSEAQSHRSLQG